MWSHTRKWRLLVLIESLLVTQKWKHDVLHGSEEIVALAFDILHNIQGGLGHAGTGGVVAPERKPQTRTLHIVFTRYT